MDKPEELEGAKLDVAVGDAIGLPLLYRDSQPYYRSNYGMEICWNPSVSWALGGPVLQKFKVTVGHDGVEWLARVGSRSYVAGRTPLLAAMRAVAVAASKKVSLKLV